MGNSFSKDTQARMGQESHVRHLAVPGDQAWSSASLRPAWGSVTKVPALSLPEGKRRGKGNVVST